MRITEREHNQVTDLPLEFKCSCIGCRNYPTRPAEVWHESQIAGKAQGHYFSRDTMKAFSSRISDFKPIRSEFSKVDSLLVLVSSRYDIEGSPRYYEIVTLCPFGEFAREWNTQGADGGPITKYSSLVKARKSALWLADIAPACSCHGCQLDRAGR